MAEPKQKAEAPKIHVTLFLSSTADKSEEGLYLEVVNIFEGDVNGSDCGRANGF